MKFLLDESAELRLASVLTELGHDVKSIVRDFPRSLADEDVLALARSEERVLITNDRDFGELIVRHQLPHAGVIYFRMTDQSIDAKQARLSYVLERYSNRLREFIVVRERSTRIRS